MAVDRPAAWEGQWSGERLGRGASTEAAYHSENQMPGARPYATMKVARQSLRQFKLVIAIPPQFDEKLKALAAKCAPEGFQYENYLPVRHERQFFGLFKWTSVFAHIWVVPYADHWRVMYSTPKGTGPFWGAQYSMQRGHDADSCVLHVWKCISHKWQPCDSSEATAIRLCIENAVELAYEQALSI